MKVRWCVFLKTIPWWLRCPFLVCYKKNKSPEQRLELHIFSLLFDSSLTCWCTNPTPSIPASWLSGCPQRFLHPAGFTPPPSVPWLQREPVLAPVIMVVHLMKRLHTESNHHDLPSLLPQEISLYTGFITPRLANSWIQFTLIDCCETGQRGLVRGNKHISRFYNITQLSGDFWLWVSRFIIWVERESSWETSV